MLYSIHGTVAHIFDYKVVIVQSGIGFELMCPKACQIALSTPITLYTYMHWSAEHGPSLFGFLQPLEKDVFLLLISCSGIGPKLGITILSAMSEVEVLSTICQQNVAGLSSIKGVGSKKAEQIVLNLKDKAQEMLINQPHISSPAVTIWSDLHQTLISLSYSAQEIKQTTSILKHQYADNNVGFDILLRKALMLLAKK